MAYSAGPEETTQAVRYWGCHAVLPTHRLAYDHHGAAAAMRRCGHANGYARTLVTGLWPSLDVFPATERKAGKRIRPHTVRIPIRTRDVAHAAE